MFRQLWHKSAQTVSANSATFSTHTKQPISTLQKMVQKNGYGGVDHASDKPLKEIANTGTKLLQYIVKTPKEGDNIFDITKAGQSDFFTFGYTAINHNKGAAYGRQALQILTPKILKNDIIDNQFPSRQNALFLQIPEQLMQEFGDLPVAISQASNNTFVLQQFADNSTESFYTGEGGATQLFIPSSLDPVATLHRYQQLHQEKKVTDEEMNEATKAFEYLLHNQQSYKDFTKALYRNAFLTIQFPCDEAVTHPDRLENQGYMRININKDGRISILSQSLSKVVSVGVTHLSPKEPTAANDTHSLRPKKMG